MYRKQILFYMNFNMTVSESFFCVCITKLHSHFLITVLPKTEANEEYCRILRWERRVFC